MPIKSIFWKVFPVTKLLVIKLIKFCSSVASSMHEKDDEVPTTTAVAFTANTSQPVSRRTRLVRGDSQFGSQGLIDGSYRSDSIDGG